MAAFTRSQTRPAEREDTDESVANGLLQDLAENERSGNPGFSMLCEEAQILSVDKPPPAAG